MRTKRPSARLGREAPKPAKRLLPPVRIENLDDSDWGTLGEFVTQAEAERVMAWAIWTYDSTWNAGMN